MTIKLTDNGTSVWAYELERDPDDGDHQPRRKLNQTDTRLAA